MLNKVCNADVFVEDKLFATLDPSTRMFELNTGQYVTQALMTDTVGFIRNLPHHLVEAFKSTLEEVLYADVILHVVDASDPLAQDKIAVAEKILGDLGASKTPTLLVLNKMDLPGAKDNFLRIDHRCPWVEVSAVTGEGLDNLYRAMAQMITETRVGYVDGTIQKCRICFLCTKACPFGTGALYRQRNRNRLRGIPKRGQPNQSPIRKLGYGAIRISRFYVQKKRYSR